MSGYTNPSINDFKNYFDRDFVFGPGIEMVRDTDISNCFIDCNAMVNPALFSEQANFSVGYLNLAAHFLVMKLRTAGSKQGLNSQYSWMQVGKSVGGVSESLQIPERIMENAELAMLSQTGYGAKYLLLILPYLVGQIFTVCGATTP